jgi:small-conductance mechanosensitive channel
MPAMRSRDIRAAGLVLLVALAGGSPVFGQGAAPPPLPQTPSQTADDVTADVSAPVVVDGVTLFQVVGIRIYPAETRALAIAERIGAIAADRSVDPSSIKAVPSADASEILAGSRVVARIFDNDARLEGIPRQYLAEIAASRVRDAVVRHRADRRPGALMWNALLEAAWALGLGLGLWLTHRLLARLRLRIERRFATRVRDVRFQSVKLLSAEQFWRLLAGVLRGAWAVGAVVVLLVYLRFALARFPWTRGLGLSLAQLLVRPLQVLAAGLVAAAPNLIFLAVLVVVTRYLLKLVALLFDAIAEKRVVFAGFDAEWAQPTYRIVRMLVIVLALVIAYPYIPGSSSDAFKGISLLGGVIVSLGSSSIVGNALAGLSMVYLRAFRVGDIVQIGEHLGKVERIRTLVTHLRTFKNEEVTIPNSVILGAQVRNYSTTAAADGVIMHTTVGIGYETPWRQVEAMLLQAASHDTTAVRAAERSRRFLRDVRAERVHERADEVAGSLLRTARAHPRRLQRIRRPDHDARLHGRPGPAQGRAEVAVVRRTCPVPREHGSGRESVAGGASPFFPPRFSPIPGVSRGRDEADTVAVFLASLVAAGSVVLAGAGVAQDPPQPPPATPTAVRQGPGPGTDEFYDVFDLVRRLRHKEVSEEERAAASSPARPMYAFAPVIGYKPSSGATFGVAGNVAVFRGDPATTRISSAVASLTFSTLKQTSLTARFGLFTARDRWKIDGDNRFQWTSQDTFGLGTGTSPSDEINLDFDYFRVYETAYRSLGHHLFGGLGIHYSVHRGVGPGRDAEAGWSGSPYVTYSEQHGFALDSQSSGGASMNFLVDTRDNAINAGRGWLGQVSYRGFFKGFLGGDSSWRQLALDARTYRKLSVDGRHKLAFWLFGDLVVGGTAPYLDLPATGMDTYGRSGRGYVEGRFRGERLVYGEVEYRGTLMKNGLLGMVAFVNTTTLASSQTGEHLFDEFASAAGAGLRLLINKRSKTNLCFDVGIGRQGSKGVYLAVQEAF